MATQRRGAKVISPKPRQPGAVAQALSALGLGSMHVRVYRSLLDRGVSTASATADAADVSRGRIYEVLQDLIENGMVTVHEGEVQNYSAYQPEIAVVSALRRLEDQLTAKRSAVAKLLPDLKLERIVQGVAIRDRLRVLHEDEDIAAFQRQLFRTAKKSFLLFEKRTLFPHLNATQIAQREWYQEKNAAMKRCSDARILVDGAILSDDTLRGRVITTINMGVSLRIAEMLPFHALVIDGRDVLLNLPETRRAPANPQVYLRHAGLAATLAESFETLWSNASHEAVGRRA